MGVTEDVGVSVGVSVVGVAVCPTSVGAAVVGVAPTPSPCVCISGVVPDSSNARGCGDVGRLLLFVNISSTKIMASSSRSSTSSLLLQPLAHHLGPVPKPQHPAS